MMRRWLEIAFGADLRSLAAMRIGLSLVLLFDLANRVLTVEAHYSDLGAFSRADSAVMASPFALCFHNASGFWFFSFLMLLLQMVLACSLLVGYRTRAVTIASWLLLVSLHHRNPTVLLGADPWLRSLLFWGMFIPWGKRWSMDADPHPEVKNQVALSAGTAGLVIQIACVYLFAGWLKSGESWWPGGSAVADTLSILEFRPNVLNISEYLLYFPNFLKFLTYGTLALEQVGIFFLFLPVFTARVRTFIVTCLIVFHLGLAMGMNLHIFPWVGVTCLLSLLPGHCWDWGPLKWLSGKLERATRLRPTWRGGCPDVQIGRRQAIGLWMVTAIMILWNVQFLYPSFKFPAVATQLVIAGGYKQNWGLFAPDAPKTSSILLPVGFTAEEERIMLTVDGAGREDFDLEQAFRYLRWRQYHLFLVNATNNGLRATYCQYLARRYNREHPERPLVSVRLLLVSRAYAAEFEDVPDKYERLYDHVLPAPAKAPEPAAAADSPEGNSLSPATVLGTGMPVVEPTPAATPKATPTPTPSPTQVSGELPRARPLPTRSPDAP